MTRSFLASLVLGAAMAATSVLTLTLTPTHKVAASRAQFTLERLVPARFGNWRIDDSVLPCVRTPARRPSSTPCTTRPWRAPTSTTPASA